MEFRNLTSDEINILENFGCTADDWNGIQVNNVFDPVHFKNVNFSGKIELGAFDKEFILPGGLKRHAGIRNACIHNCKIGNNVLIENIHNHIANYIIGDDTLIRNLELMYVDGETSFGNGVEVSTLNETGGREVMMHNKLSAHFAYILSFYRHKPLLIKKMQQMVEKYANECKSTMGRIGSNVTIRNAGTIKDVCIGDYAVVEGVQYLENGTLVSNEHDPIHVGYNVMMKDFIVNSGSSVEDGTMLTRCFVGQACQLGHTYSASDSLFFSNCQGENGEACAIFAGPYTVTHHKSTLLISGLYSFMNAGSGSNQSNHMYKLGPIHQGVMERGSKTTSDSYVLWPAKIGAYSLVMGRHYRNSDTSTMPFSYLIEHDDQSLLFPGINLKSVGTIRDAQKFPKRDRRKDPNKLDQINFNLLSPYTVQKMFQGIFALKELQNACGETSDTYTYRSCKIKNSSLRAGLKYYNLAIQKFLGNSIISRLRDCECKSNVEIRACLKPDSEAGLYKWRDIAGLLAPSSEVDVLVSNIENDVITEIDQVNDFLKELHTQYYSYEWTWAWNEIKEYYHVSLETITATDIIHIIECWKTCVVELDKMIYDDAKKEFSLSSQISFGMDGNKTDRKIDFEQVRGVFEENTFVKTVIEHVQKKTQLGNDMTDKLKKAL